jgi:hypothetical protein
MQGERLHRKIGPNFFRNRGHGGRTEESLLVNLRDLRVLCAFLLALQIHRSHRHVPVRIQNLESPLLFALVSLLVGK